MTYDVHILYFDSYQCICHSVEPVTKCQNKSIFSLEEICKTSKQSCYVAHLQVYEATVLALNIFKLTYTYISE